MADVTFTVDGKKLTAPAGTLLIEACREASIAIPQFCYYPGLSLQAACRMCLVRLEKVPKLQTACTTPVAEGMVVTTESDEIIQARKATVELLLGNHPLDCPVCDAGGECELQDMTFKYGAPESLYIEAKQHREEQQWSPVVFFDRPALHPLLPLRAHVRRRHGRLGPGSAEPRRHQHHRSQREATTSTAKSAACASTPAPSARSPRAAYRYKTRPWEMNHVSTVCTHCGDGCKTTLGVRSVDNGSEIIRGDNRDKSGINGDFLCIKGRYAFDFANHADRLTKPLVRQPNGKLAEVSWEQALDIAGRKLREIRDSQGGNAIGVIGSNRTTNEENYLLQKFARTVLGHQQHRSSPHRRLHRFCSRHLRTEGPRCFAARDHDRAGHSAAGQ